MSSSLKFEPFNYYHIYNKAVLKTGYLIQRIITVFSLINSPFTQKMC